MALDSRLSPGPATTQRAWASHLGIDQESFCRFDDNGASAVDNLGAGLYHGVTPDSWSKAYNEHVGGTDCI